MPEQAPPDTATELRRLNDNLFQLRQEFYESRPTKGRIAWGVCLGMWLYAITVFVCAGGVGLFSGILLPALTRAREAALQVAERQRVEEQERAERERLAKEKAAQPTDPPAK